MNILKVDIKNFRSYRNFTAVDFHKGLNVIVGHNGVGKSNLLLAIRLVMCVEQFAISERERKVLLHNNGIGPNTTGYVEVVFDNSNNRLPINATEVKIRHTLTAGSSRFTINDKEVVKNQVIALWETSGISSRNPYFWVGQGAICKVINAGSRKRLVMLQDIIGVTIHREKVTRTSTILDQIMKLRDSLQTITEDFKVRFEEIRSQTVELRDVEDLEDRIKAIEYILNQKEYQLAERALREVRNRYNAVQRTFCERMANCQEKENCLKSVEDELTKWHGKKSVLDEKLKGLYERVEKLTIVQVKTKYEYDHLKAEQDKIRAAKDAKIERIRRSEEQEEDTTQAMRAALWDENGVTMKRTADEITKKELQSSVLKRKKYEVYESVDDHRSRITNEIRHLHDQLHKITNQESDLASKVSSLTHEIEVTESKLNENKAELIEMNRLISTHEDESKHLGEELDSVTSTIRESCGEENAISANLKRAKGNLKSKEQLLFRNDYWNYKETVKLIKKLCEETQQCESENYFGMVIENVSCDEPLYTAVDVIGNKKLFNHIFATDVFATQLSNAYNRDKLRGSLNMLAFNRILYRDVDYSALNTTVIKPLMNTLNFDPQYEPVMKYVFGNAVICRNEDDLIEYAKKKRLNCVTLEGTQCTSRGALSGGYYDRHYSLMYLQGERRVIQRDVSEMEHDIEELIQHRIAAENRRTQLDAKRSKVISKMAKDRCNRANLHIAIQQQVNDLAMLKNSREFYSQKLQAIQNEAIDVKEKIEFLQQELQRDWDPHFTSEEENQLRILTEDINRLRKSHIEDYKKRQKNAEWNEKRKAHQKARAQLTQEVELETNGVQEHQVKLDRLQQELQRLESSLNQVNELCREKEETRNHFGRSIDNCSKEVEKFKEENDKASADFHKIDVEKDKCLTEMKKSKARVYELKKVIAAMDCIKTRLCDHFQQFSNAELRETLQQLKADRDAFQAVNRNALNEYHQLHDRLEELMNQNDELTRQIEFVNTIKNDTVIHETAAIDITYEQVKTHFSEIFSRLAPRGRGELILCRDALKQKSFGRPSLSTTSESTVTEELPYNGIDLLVSFTGNELHGRHMEHLSGGQKSLTALAFILAIHACDWMPIYLLDEIDSHLDQASRENVADLLKDYAANAQIITTTFRPQLVNKADRIFRVYYYNRSSAVQMIAIEEAISQLTLESPQSVASGVNW